MSNTLTVQIYADLATAWARVPTEIVHELGIRRDIRDSKLGPNANFIFLNMEEDGRPFSDFDVFADAADDRGLAFKTIHLEVGKDIDVSLEQIKTDMTKNYAANKALEAASPEAAAQVSATVDNLFSKDRHGINEFQELVHKNTRVFLPEQNMAGVVQDITVVGDGERLSIALDNGKEVQVAPAKGAVERIEPHQSQINKTKSPSV